VFQLALGYADDERVEEGQGALHDGGVADGERVEGPGKDAFSFHSRRC
jgi:hypothetical protein